MARILEGTFETTSGPRPTVMQTDGKPVDAELFTRLGLILVQAQAERARPADVVEKIGPHSPTLARRLSRLMDDPQAFAILLAALITGLAGITAALIATNQATPQIINNIRIEQPPSEGDLNRYRERFWKLRLRKIPVPSWVRNYIEPQEG